MERLKTRFVIFARSQNNSRRYLARDGTVTALRRYAVKFTHRAEAQAFASIHNLVLGKDLHLGEEEFLDFELRL